MHSGILINSGHTLENITFIALRRLTTKIFYYKTQNNLEVDFIIHLDKREYFLIQACESLQDPATRQREVKALTTAMVELKLTKGFIVTNNHDEIISNDISEIIVISAWRFLLETTTLFSN